ncbi:hypothetical protein [Lysinibacillus sp. 3P01SB]|uniref:hypothetical protein n=1 Tax=Lysinibacillus sp. 3P01SB TaxID=3132284 RepID=UPI0039A4DA2E
MRLTVEQMLVSKGITPKEGHLEILEARWKEMSELRGDLDGIKIDDADIALKNIAGGDHHE